MLNSMPIDAALCGLELGDFALRATGTLSQKPVSLALELGEMITIEQAYKPEPVCEECGTHPDDLGNYCEKGIYPYYGLGPHTHNPNGRTVFLKSKPPENFSPDPEAPGCGVYTHCLTCGAGK